MTAGLSPRARAELDALARVEGPRLPEAILISHQRRDVGSCLCGWSKLGKSHAGHQVDMLRAAGVLAEPYAAGEAGLEPASNGDQPSVLQRHAHPGRQAFESGA